MLAVPSPTTAVDLLRYDSFPTSAYSQRPGMLVMCPHLYCHSQVLCSHHYHSIGAAQVSACKFVGAAGCSRTNKGGTGEHNLGSRVLLVVGLLSTSLQPLNRMPGSMLGGVTAEWPGLQKGMPNHRK